MITLLALWYNATRNTSPLGLQEASSVLVLFLVLYLFGLKILSCYVFLV